MVSGPSGSDKYVAVSRYGVFRAYSVPTGVRQVSNVDKGKHPVEPGSSFFRIGDASRLYDHIGQCKRRVPTGSG